MLCAHGYCARRRLSRLMRYTTSIPFLIVLLASALPFAGPPQADYAWRYLEHWQEHVGPRAAFAACYHPFGGVTFVTGYKHESKYYYPSTWINLNKYWWELSYAHPTDRQFASMVYFPPTGETILFGGSFDGRYLDDTQALGDLLDRWYEPVRDGPDRRDGHSMVYNPTSEMIWLFGGRNDRQFFADAWEYDGRAWSPLIVSGDTPEPRAYHSLVFDPGRNVAILYGGLSESGTIVDDTWEFDGQTWTNVTTDTSPGARFGHSAAYDPHTHRMVVFGGEGLLAPYNDVWTYSGIWRKATTLDSRSRARYATPQPQPRSFAMLEYDPDIDGFVVFGGFGEAGMLADTWQLIVP